MNVTVKPLTDDKNKVVDGSFHVSLERKTLTAWYVYSVALIPLIFGLLFLHLLFFSASTSRKRCSRVHQALIVAILAVLPLRAVLVPADIEGLTRVDLVLRVHHALLPTKSVKTRDRRSLETLTAKYSIRWRPTRREARREEVRLRATPYRIIPCPRNNPNVSSPGDAPDVKARRVLLSAENLGTHPQAGVGAIVCRPKQD